MTESRIAFRLGLLSTAVALLTPPATYAQAICSAPHSSPSLTQSGSIKTLPQGAGWLQVSLFRQQADESFNHLGNRQPFLANGKFDTRSIFLTGALGLTRGLELWAQLPVHNLSADAAGENSTSTGVGDVRLAGRIGTEQQLPGGRDCVTADRGTARLRD